ncbi:hypothetical protein [Gallaecimonas pentaromativorans]|uniref:hypothetical protein n=1 Tax=Gallaecimonas pentaromativorans TaxID=584787 RepID=UPI003A925CEA
MTKFERIQENVPEGTILPDELRRVCEYLDDSGYPISGCMKIRPDDFGGICAWFGNDSLMASNFAYFGAGPDGSILSFWLLNGKDATHAPIVHLGSEGSNNIVLAENFHSFLRLFGIGYDELGFDDLQKPPEAPESAANFRVWLERELEITCPETGAEIVREAQRFSPDIQEAIDIWYKKRYGENA